MSEEFRREFQGYQQRTWAGPVEQLDLTTGLLEMGKWLDSLDEIRCEAEHADFRNRKCSSTVTHKEWPCTGHGHRLVCERQAAWVNSWSTSDVLCFDCDRPCYTHWRAVPV